MKKKIFGFMMGLIILLIIPFMSMNVEQIQSVTEEITGNELQTNGFWDIGGRAWVYVNFGYLRGNWHEVVDWSFWDADRDLTVMFMTEANYLLFADGSSYSRILLSSGELSDSGSFVVSASNYYRLVYHNDNFLRNTFYIEQDHDAIEAGVSVSLAYIDYDSDFYYDRVRFDLRIYLNYNLAEKVSVKYSFEARQSGVLIDSYVDTVLVSSMSGKSVSLTFYDEVGVFDITIRVFYDSQTSADAQIYRKTNYLYPLGYGFTPTQTPTQTPSKPGSDRPLGLYIGLPLGIVSLVGIVVPVSVVTIRKRRGKKVPQETEEIKSELEQPRLCPECGEITEESEMFCGNCGINLSKVNNNG